MNRPKNLCNLIKRKLVHKINKGFHNETFGSNLHIALYYEIIDRIYYFLCDRTSFYITEQLKKDLEK